MYDAEQAQSGSSQQITAEKGHHSRHSNWDLGLVTGFRKLEHDYEDFDPRNAKEAHLVYADGDLPKNRVSNYRSDASKSRFEFGPWAQFAKFYHYLLNVSIVTRWFLFIVPILGILWIPGILGLTAFPNAHVRDGACVPNSPAH
jgi:hypothetical protein